MLPWSLEQGYAEYPRIEEDFDTALDESLAPRGPDFLYDLVANFPAGTATADVGCGDGTHARALTTRFGFAVTALDPVVPDDVTGLRFVAGSIEALPLADVSVDLVWCRDVMVHVADLDRAYAELRRVLRPGGTALVYQMFATDLLEPREAAALWAALGVVPSSTDRATTERAFKVNGFHCVRSESLSSEWGERDGRPARKLVHAARLLRDRDRWVARYGERNYAIKLADCHWHVYAMLGKLTRHVYVLQPRA